MAISIDVNFPELRRHVIKDTLLAQLSLLWAQEEEEEDGVNVDAAMEIQGQLLQHLVISAFAEV